MIRAQKALTLAETRELLKGVETEKAKALADFIKKFTKQTAAEVAQLRAALQQLGLTKLSDEHIVALINFMPEEASDVRKIFVGSELSLDQDEIEAILKALKKK